jgi:polyphosphate kinase
VEETRTSVSERLLNRELSWLDFNARVLQLAEDPAMPLLERAKFLAIFSTNLDEFFQIRVAGLEEQRAVGKGITSPDGRTPPQQLEEIRCVVAELMSRHSAIFTDQVAPALAREGVHVIAAEELSQPDAAHVEQVFTERIFPVLTPLAVDPGRPFPYISSLSLNLAVVVRGPDGQEHFARVKVPSILPRFISLPGGGFLPLEQVIATRLERLFEGMTVEAAYPFRVTRNADFEIEEEEAPDLLDAIESELLRRRFGRAVRLEVHPTMPADVRGVLQRELRLESRSVYTVTAPLDLSGLWALHGLDRPDAKDPPWVPVTPPQLADSGVKGSIFTTLRQHSVLLHHPYDTFEGTVEAFVEAAAADPAVLAIKQTLYRTTADSRIVEALIRAAGAGKQAVALVELKARFDEAANIERARRLEEAGVHVVYGLVGLKTHAKICLVVRAEDGGIRRYAHVGTGNYNASTARIYEDLGLLTCDEEIGADLSELFNVLTGYSLQRDYRQIVTAPHRLRDRILELIAEQTAAGSEGAITIKVNSLVDRRVIEALYEASAAGVRIDLVVRGISCIRPGVPGLSDQIRVRSIVGRFLEHSRIFRFGRAPRPVRYLIGSADLMPRNLDRRVEALTPITDPQAQARLDEILDLCLEDDVRAWEQHDATWRRVETRAGHDVQVRLQALALQRTRG